VGVEINEQAINDAKHNATMNGMRSNFYFKFLSGSL